MNVHYYNLSEHCTELGEDFLGRPLLGKLWNSINMHLNAPNQKSATNSTLIKVVTRADDQLIRCI